jgi:glucose-6-phosphate 1-dehydrogenase
VEDVKGQMEAYERLLGDAMVGDSTLFGTQEVVEASWAIVDPVLGEPARYEYQRGTTGPPEADQLVADIGGWTR